MQLLANESVVIDGIRFAGIDLCTDFGLCGNPEISGRSADTRTWNSAAYANHLDRKLSESELRPSATVHGYIHESAEYELDDGTWVFANPAGYQNFDDSPELDSQRAFVVSVSGELKRVSINIILGEAQNSPGGTISMDQDFNNENPRSRDQVGLKTALRILEKWGVERKDQAQVLGIDPEKLDFPESFVRLESRQLEAVSYLLNIHASLRDLFQNPENQYGYMKSVNHNLPFRGQSPLDFILSGELPALKEVFHHLELVKYGQ